MQDLSNLAIESDANDMQLYKNINLCESHYLI